MQIQLHQTLAEKRQKQGGIFFVLFAACHEAMSSMSFAMRARRTVWRRWGSFSQGSLNCQVVGGDQTWCILMYGHFERCSRKILLMVQGNPALDSLGSFSPPIYMNVVQKPMKGFTWSRSTGIDLPDMRERYLSRNVNIGERFAEDPRKTR